MADLKRYCVALRGREELVIIHAVSSTNRGAEYLEFMDAGDKVGAAFRLEDVQGWWLGR